MKPLLIALLFSPFISLSQQVDSTKMRLERLEYATQYMAGNLKLSGKQYTAGIIMQIAGVGAAVASIPSHNKSTKNILLYSGAAVSALGLIAIISSHTTIADAGKWKFWGNSITVDF